MNFFIHLCFSIIFKEHGCIFLCEKFLFFSIGYSIFNSVSYRILEDVFIRREVLKQVVPAIGNFLKKRYNKGVSIYKKGIFDRKGDEVSINRFSVDFGEESSPKYVQLYRHIKKCIESDRLAADEKLPSIRKLAAYLGVNPSTVVGAYELLEKERYIYKKEKSGCYVYPESKQENSSVSDIRFDLANPKSGMFDTNNFKKAVELAIADEGESLFEYQEGLGYEPLRKRICEYIAQKNIFSNPDRIQIISGAQQGISLISKVLLSYGDVVFVEEPSYPGALEVFRENGIKVVGVPLLDDGIDIGILKMRLEKIRPALFYIMPNFQNPTGITYSKKKKLALLDLAQKYDFLIVEDDYISDFSFMAEDNYPIRSYDDRQLTIYIKSFSKILMPGLRIAFMEMPGHIRNRMSRAKYSMDISTSSFIQLSLFYYMKYFDWNEHLSSVGKRYEKRFRKADKIIGSEFIDLVTFRKASGGINFFGSLPKDYSSMDLKQYLARHQIKILEGTLFYPSVQSENDFRISIVHMEDKDLEENLRILKRYIKQFLQDHTNKMKYKAPNLVESWK